MIFFVEWIIFYIAIIFAMSLDNIFWIPTSPEYEQFKNNTFPIKVENEWYKNKTDYIFRYRIWSVLKSWRDIIPGLISSFILAVVL